MEEVHDSGCHCGQKHAQLIFKKNQTPPIAKKLDAFAHLTHKALDSGFRGCDVGTQLLGSRHHVPSFSHREVTERNQVRREIDEQHSAHADAVVDESDDRTRNKPASYSGQQKSICVDEFLSGSQLLDQGRDRGPDVQKPAATSVFIR